MFSDASPGSAASQQIASPTQLAGAIRNAALALGFSRVGFCDVEPLARGQKALADWLAEGRHGEMAYLSRTGRADPRALLDGARSLVVVALTYARDPAPVADPMHGVIARYARGTDYHGVLKSKLRQLAEQCSQIVGRPILSRPCVDTAPLLEREAAARAGVGFIAKSTMAIVPGVGTYVLLGELLLDVEVAPDAPVESRCGRCTACLDACPTRAFVGPQVLDARRCISYLTIEARGPMPRELRPLIGNRVFGCDICQEVCPFNAAPGPRPSAPELAPRPQLSAPALVDLLRLTAGDYRRLVKGSALQRASRNQLARNAAVALGNSGDAGAVTALAEALHHHKSALVRGHAAWALGRLGGGEARTALQQAASDPDLWVREEAAAASAACT